MVVGGILFAERNSDRDTGSRMHSKNDKFREMLSSVAIVKGVSGRLLELVKMFESAFRISGKDLGCVFETEPVCEKHPRK